MKKTFALAGLLSVSMLCFAGSKSYDVTFANPSQVGAVTLAPGDYKVKVEGGNAVFTSVKNNKSVSTAVKTETSNKKFQFTAVDASKNGGTEKVNAIELGGSTTRLDFTPSAGATPAVPGGSQQ